NEDIEKKFKEICEGIFKDHYSNTNFSPNVTWKQKLFKNFINNINMYVDNIHIRFEENYTHDYNKKCFNFGVAISRLERINTNKNGDEFFLDYEAKKEIGKSFSNIRLYRLSIYFNASGQNVSGDS